MAGCRGEVGRGAFVERRFSADLVVELADSMSVLAEAHNAEGQVQPLKVVWISRDYCNNQVIASPACRASAEASRGYVVAPVGGFGRG